MGKTDYEVQMIKKFDVTQLKPFQCAIQITIKDREFEKRLTNMMKKYGYGLDVHVFENFMTRLFYKLKFNMEVGVSTGYGITLDKSFVSDPANVTDPKLYSFDTKDKLDVFAVKAAEAILSWLNDQYKKYMEKQQQQF
ncbi:hypothetical protein [Paenibacillus taichungensis]|uniref:hypothetical protein n=1 Tax=Paenibacillus taichungensis TaxID=484184 RepID=UPI0035DFDC0B